MTRTVTSSRASAWLTTDAHRRGAEVRLFCFPYAGAGASVYRTWGDALGPAVEVCPVQLPGRESRLREPALDRLAHVVTAVADALEPGLDRRFALFGHSMGALIAFELARELRRRGLSEPARVFVSGRSAPHLPSTGAPLHRLADPALIAELKRRGGTPREVLASDELMQLLLPILRADFAVCERYAYRDDVPLGCPISAFAADADELAPPAAVAAWREHTSAAFTLRELQGRHFFLRSAAAEMWAAIAADLEGGPSCR